MRHYHCESTKAHKSTFAQLLESFEVFPELKKATIVISQCFLMGSYFSSKHDGKALKLQQHKHVFDSFQVSQVFVFKQQTLYHSQIALRSPCSQVDIIQPAGIFYEY